ncbi:MAG TPA: nucleotide exchange factor GrpE [bacterium]|jgi:molecular chaperone GrpE|nr:nucleotide exchange factor GrpE [bacterium]HOG38161.1 nucleotide exchange factor GrpE [bacterium]HQI03381.1 nucleotide exchange factor GrpE [bacterium]
MEKKIKNKTSKEVEELKLKNEEYLNGWKRAQADFENYKKQTEKRIKDVIEFGNAEMILELLPLFSHFNSALTHVKEEDRQQGWFIGLEHIKKLWMDFFEKFGINQIKTIGEQFDHNKHEAVDFEELADCNDNEILTEVTPGFELNGKVIQPAKVIVCKNNNKNNNKIKDSTDFRLGNQKTEFDSEKGE